MVNIQEWIRHPEVLDKDTLYELRTIVIRYPYFQTARLLYLKNLYVLHDIRFGEELRRSALYIADRSVLFYLIEGDRYRGVGKETGAGKLVGAEEKTSADRTLSLIDSFLATMPPEITSQTELDYTTDYTAYLLRDDDNGAVMSEDTETKLSGQELIDNFIRNVSEASPVRMLADRSVDNGQEAEHCLSPQDAADKGSVSEPDDEGCFTETLAKIYIRQKRYSKALEIIKKLSLKYPKKNAYFADQIRFLEKLIINAKSK